MATQSALEDQAAGTDGARPPAVPIVAGFYPDPSICRVGQDYYLANSSFEYLPGVPLFHSTDLISWKQIGNALQRPDQLDVSQAASSLGVCAPTLRHHEGTFWLITTNSAQVERGHLLLSAEDPAGPWSPARYIPGVIGIDPDLAWDEDGTCYLTWTSFDPRWFGIVQATLDTTTGQLLEEPRQLWSGTGLASPEGPHLLRRGSWWYLLLAEGGTERGHSVTVARSRSPRGPFEPHPHNPVLTHRSTDHPVQNTGHADLVEGPDGQWSMVHLGVRPRGGGPGFHVNGRESFLVGVDWQDDWPVIDENRYSVPAADHSFIDTFDTSTLHPRWISPRRSPEDFTAPAPGGGLHIEATAEHNGALLTRTRDEHWRVDVTIATDGGATARFALRLDDNHWYALDADATSVTARAQVGTLGQSVAQSPRDSDGTPVHLFIRTRPAVSSHPALPTDPDLIDLGHLDGEQEVLLATLEGRYLSSEVAGGFTGRVVGVQALDASAHLQRFEYRTTSAT
ncbi:family 43 glycosylhydrolase [Streptomyces sp. NPDC005426]|uniref:glycoside hydrolase family 43 protein n=1 Tax=Streptomyces sp. NPDC005426 TaxID=3155344 RepID=UPI0033A8B319